MENMEQIVDHLNNLNVSGQYAEVLNETQNYLATEKEEPVFWILQGNALYGLERLEEALSAFGEAIRLDPMNVEARSNYGSTLFALGRYVDALNACDAAILTDRDFAPAYLNAANCLMALGHDDHAVYALNHAFKLDPQNMELGLKTAEMLTEIGEYEMAKETFFAVAKLPDAPQDIQTRIFNFFQEARERNIDRKTIIEDANKWKRLFPTQEVLAHYKDLAR